MTVPVPADGCRESPSGRQHVAVILADSVGNRYVGGVARQCAVGLLGPDEAARRIAAGAIRSVDAAAEDAVGWLSRLR